jgi:hypothetical protein
MPLPYNNSILAQTITVSGNNTSITGVLTSSSGNFLNGLAISGVPIGEVIDDEVAGLLVAGSGINLNYNDNVNTLTISTSGLTVADISGASSLSTTGLSITKTGDWHPASGAHPLFVFVPAQATQIENTFVRYSGKWIANWTYQENFPTWMPGRLTSLTFNDLEGITGSFTVANMTAFTALSLPQLRYVGGSVVIGALTFGQPGMQALTAVSFPALSYVGGAINSGLVGALTTLSFPALTYVGGNFDPGFSGVSLGMTAITALTAPNLRQVFTFGPSGLTALTTLSMPALAIVRSNFSPSFMNALTAWSFPELSFVGGNFSPSTMSNLTTLSMPALSFVGGTFNPGTMAALTTLSVPALTVIGSNLKLNNFAALTTVSLPALSSIGSSTGSSISVISMNALTTLSLPSLATLVGGGVSLTAPALANVTLPTNGTFKNGGLAFSCTGAALTQASVNNILQAYASLNGTNGTTSWVNTLNVSGGTSAAPSNLGSTTTPGSQFVCAGTTCTVNWTGHGYATGDVLRISGITTATNANRYARITVVNANQFTYTITSQTATGAGTATVVKAGASANALVTRGVTLTTN